MLTISAEGQSDRNAQKSWMVISLRGYLKRASCILPISKRVQNAPSVKQDWKSASSKYTIPMILFMPAVISGADCITDN